jgi:predicted nuclease of restriction endonuclease-like (RecB) superfamily
MSQTFKPDIDSYLALLHTVKKEIVGARTRAVLAVNQELILVYWRIGDEILSREAKEGWGSKVIDRLSSDLRQEFPDMKGLSTRNVRYMRAFAKAWPDLEIVQQLVAQLPWGHNTALLKLSNPEVRVWYAQRALEDGWSRNVLEHHITSRLHERDGKALSNFARTLPAPDSDLVQQITKDPYNFEFLELASEAKEVELEKALLNNMRRFILELGVGLAFVGSQYCLEVAGDESFIDLLFFHIPLNRYVVIELKTGKFRPEYAGQLGFYTTAVDQQICEEHHHPTIGLILCASRNETVAEYTLRDITKPIGIAGYDAKQSLRLTTQVPPELTEKLPSVPELKAKLKHIISNNDNTNSQNNE